MIEVGFRKFKIPKLDFFNLNFRAKIIAGALILALKFITEIISFILSDFFLGLGAILVVGGAVILALKFFKENRDDADDEPFRGIKQ